MQSKEFYVLWYNNVCEECFDSIREVGKYIRDNFDVFELKDGLYKLLISDDFKTLKNFQTDKLISDNVIEINDNFKLERRVVLFSDFNIPPMEDDVWQAYNWFIDETRKINPKSKFNFSEVERLIHD